MRSRLGLIDDNTADRGVDRLVAALEATRR
jgi:hypothetical protein